MLSAQGRRRTIELIPPAKRGLFRQHYPLLSGIWVCLDAAVGVICALGAALVLVGDLPPQYRIFGVVACLTMVPVYWWSGLFHNLRTRQMYEEAWLLLSNLLAVLVCLFAIGYLTGTYHYVSLDFILLWSVTVYAGQVALHGAVRIAVHAARRRAMNIRRVLLIGSRDAASRFAERIARNAWLGLNIVGFIECEPPTRSQHAPASDEEQGQPGALLSRLGSLEDLPRVIEAHEVEQVYLTLPVEETHAVASTNRSLLNFNVDVHWVPDLSVLHLINHSVREIDGQPILCLSDSPLATGQAAVKRLEDIIVASVLLVAISPLLVAIALAIKLTSPGPILFKQRRLGLNGKTIWVWKFRTMVVESSEEKPLQATRDDPRVTPVGRFLRRWSLDELPQLFHVLQGRMSVVGPRPHPLWLNERYRDTLQGYMQRHRIKPGITGWAQVNGWRGETDSEEKMEMRLRHDLYYVSRWSLWLDLKILMLSMSAVVRGDNAY